MSRDRSNWIRFIIKLIFQVALDSSNLNQPFIADDDEVDEDIKDDADDDSEDESDLFDSVCAICDNGGELLWYVFLFFGNIFLYLLYNIQVLIQIVNIIKSMNFC